MIGGSLRPRQRAISLDHDMHSRVYSKDEELGKRNDNFRPRHTSNASTLLLPWRWRKRRLLAVVGVIVALYFFVANIPRDLGPIDQRMGMALRPGYNVETSGSQKGPDGAPPRPSFAGETDESKHYYDGPIKFYRLALSLHGISRTQGAKQVNRNVLFAVSSLKSASNLIPMACEMARWDRNYVNFVILGRDPLPLEDVLEINGVHQEDCAVYFHDGRSDFSEYSSDKRGETAIAGAMKHINDFMHPQAIIMDDSTVEDKYFTRAMRSKAKDMGRALIEVPAGRYEQFLWMTRLDSGGLASWFMPNIDILIHALPNSSGGLLRLVKSLQRADYTGLKIPRLTIELPSGVDPFARRYFERLEWPPTENPSPVREHTLSLRHRIPSAHASSEQASIRFLESFYPANAQDNHVLVLSPQAELSPIFLQYLHYTILEYKYSSYGTPTSQDVFGLSLDIPTTFLNGTGDFVAPVVADMTMQKYTDASVYDQAASTHFLYQAPSATASLIFGDKWALLHDFLSNRLASSQAGKASKPKKLVSETEPSWLEYLLELMRARGWSMLHPAVSFVTVHNELSQVPEEYLRGEGEGQKEPEELKQSDRLNEEPFLTALEPPVMLDHIEREQPATQPLHEVLPFEGDLPELTHLPHLSYAGDLMSVSAAAEMMKEYVQVFRRHVGGCDARDALRHRMVWLPSTEDLFCLPGVDLGFDVKPDEKEKEVAEAIAHSTDEEKAAHEDKAAQASATISTSQMRETNGATVETEAEVDSVSEKAGG